MSNIEQDAYEIEEMVTYGASYSDIIDWLQKRDARTHPPAKVPEGWKLVEHPTCYQLHRGNEIVAVLAGPDAEANAEKLKALLTTPTPATTPETDWVKLPHDVVINGGMTFRKGVKLSTFIKAAERWHREAMKQYAGISKEEIQALMHQTPTARSDGDCEIPPIYVVVTVCYQEGCSDWPAIEFPGHFSDADIEDNIYEDLYHEMHSNPGFRSYSWRRVTTPPQEQ